MRSSEHAPCVPQHRLDRLNTAVNHDYSETVARNYVYFYSLPVRTRALDPRFRIRLDEIRRVDRSATEAVAEPVATTSAARVNGWDVTSRQYTAAASPSTSRLKGSRLTCVRNARSACLKSICSLQDIFRPALRVMFGVGGVVSRDYTPGEELVASDVVVARELHRLLRKFDNGHGVLGFEVATEVVDIADILVGHGVID